jgi:hypothetical protein
MGAERLKDKQAKCGQCMRELLRTALHSQLQRKMAQLHFFVAKTNSIQFAVRISFFFCLCSIISNCNAYAIYTMMVKIGIVGIGNQQSPICKNP